MKVKSGPVPESRAATAELVAQTLRIDLLCIFTSMLLTFAMNCHSLAVSNWTQSMEYTKLALQIVDHSCNLLMALSLSGALTGALAAHSEKRNRDTQRLRRRRVMSMSFAAGEHDPQWTEKVVELAGRGFTLEKLLEFYETLGRDCMLHYDPRRSTTHDVVRQAIIPLSRGNRCALATLMMGGVHTQPKKMITHNWSNRFCHLVAAIVADALDEPEYSMIALMLADGTEKIKAWVRYMGVHKNTYWVCAFSVNQHCSICGGCPDGSRDTVTGELFADSPCPCDLPKMFNTTPPLLSDGRGIECEMNKFHTMMKYLAAKDPEFHQVVAIDGTFTLFSRAWCIAEIATANEVGMRQFLKIDSADTLKKHAGRLRSLKIEDMESARPEDKVDILNSIADTDAFNNQLQHLLFTELLPDWGDMNSLEIAVMIGHFIRWAETSAEFDQAPSEDMLGEAGAVASLGESAEPCE